MEERANVICSTAEVDKDVTFGKGNVVHPLAKIKALNGPIVIGDGNVIHELADIRNLLPLHENGEPQTLRVGDGNLFETGCTVRSRSIGDHNVFRVQSSLGLNSQIESYSLVVTRRAIGPNNTLPSNTIVYGSEGESRPAAVENRPDPEVAMMAAFLRQTLPSFHTLQ
ncbi:Dynactin subunit 6 [Diplonema papillatum]|nr:Dynactin subunit 6 [Diplonema papillatum]